MTIGEYIGQYARCDSCGGLVDLYDVMAHDAVCGTGDRIKLRLVETVTEDMSVPLDTVENKEKDTEMSSIFESVDNNGRQKVPLWLGPMNSQPEYIPANKMDGPVPGVKYDTQGRVVLTASGCASVVKGGKSLLNAWRQAQKSGKTTSEVQEPTTIVTRIDSEHGQVAGDTSSFDDDLMSLLAKVSLAFESATEDTEVDATIQPWFDVDKVWKSRYRYVPLRTMAARFGFPKLSNNQLTEYFDKRNWGKTFREIWDIPVVAKAAATNVSPPPPPPPPPQVQWYPLPQPDPRGTEYTVIDGEYKFR